VGLDVSTSRGLKGGHPEIEGIAEDGSVIEVGDHAHRVEMDLTRFEFSLSRTFDKSWDVVVRVPYFLKDQTAETVFPNAISEEDKAAAIRLGNAHHRTDTYEGFSDLEVSVGWRKTSFLLEGSVFRFSLGVTVPVGDTENDPLVAGDAGLEHLHVQFGNGTFDPLVDFYFGLPLNERFAVSLFGRGRFPFYENDQGYQGSLEGTLGPRLTWLPHKRWSFSAGMTGSYYGYSEWSNRRDPNSGQFSLNASLGFGVKITDQLTASLNALLPVYTKTFSGEDSLDPAPTFSLSAGWTF